MLHSLPEQHRLPAAASRRALPLMARWLVNRRVAVASGPVGAENLRDQTIFVNHAPGAIAPLDPELIEIRDAVGQLP